MPDSAMGWEHPGMLPGHLAALRRLEARERLEEAERAALAQERADERFQAWAMRRMQEMAFRGQPYNPNDPRTLMQPESEFLAQTWAALDAVDAREYRRALLDAGMLHLLDPPPPAPVDGSPPETAARTGLRAKVREVLHRGGAVACMCPTCVAVRASRTKERKGR
jgi:hypothetical protein